MPKEPSSFSVTCMAQSSGIIGAWGSCTPKNLGNGRATTSPPESTTSPRQRVVTSSQVSE